MTRMRQSPTRTSADYATAYRREVVSRIDALTRLAEAGGLDSAVQVLVEAIQNGGVIQAFGSGHSEAFAMEIAGRAGGLVPTNRAALRDAVIYGSRSVAELDSNPPLERDPGIAADVFATISRHPADAFVFASNSGVNGSIVELALLAKKHGHPVIAVTSLVHTAAVTPKHPSGKRLAEVADVVIDNLAPYGDATLDPAVTGTGDVPMGAVSSITSAYIAQLLTVGVAVRLSGSGQTPPVYVSANVPGGDERNQMLEARYAGRLRRGA